MNGPINLPDLTPPQITPVVPARDSTSDFGKYQNNAAPDKKRISQEENDDKESGRRSFSAYTNNDYGDAG